MVTGSNPVRFAIRPAFAKRLKAPGFQPGDFAGSNPAGRTNTLRRSFCQRSRLAVSKTANIGSNPIGPANVSGERNMPRLSTGQMALVHLVLLIGWALCIPASLIFGFIESVAFVSVASIYANMATHWSAWQATRAEKKQDDSNNS